MSKSRNGTTETLESTKESMDKAVESAEDARLEASAIVDDAVASDSAQAPPATEAIADDIEAEDEQQPSRRRRIVRGGTIVLVTAAVAVTAGVGLAMVLRGRGADEETAEDFVA